MKVEHLLKITLNLMRQTTLSVWIFNPKPEKFAITSVPHPPSLNNRINLIKKIVSNQTTQQNK